MAQTKYLTSLCESYKDFVYIFDEDLGVYVVSEAPTSTNTEYVFVNITDENKKDSLDDVIAFIDDYYEDLKDDSDEDIEVEASEEIVDESIETLNEDTLKDMFGDVFLITVVKSEDGEKEFIEFNNIKEAQDYIDKLKIDNDDFFSSATLVDENGEELDSWTYISDEDRSNDKLVKRVTVKEADEEIIDEFENEEIVDNEETDEIVVDDEKVEVEETTSNDLIDILNNATNVAGTFANNMKMLHWYSAGHQFDRIHNITSDYYDKAGEDLDLLAELVLEFGGKVINPSNMASACELEVVEIPEEIGYDRDKCLNLVRENITIYLNALKEIYNAPNVTSDVTSEIDVLVRYWDKENNYKNIRRLAEF